MNFYSLLIKKECIAGLEFAEGAIRLALLETDDHGGKRLRALTETELAPGIIVEGVVKDPEKLTATIKELLKKSGVAVTYVIATIPADQIYAKLFNFPRHLSPEQLNEAIGLKVNFQMPENKEKAYVDWQELPEKEQKEFFVASSRKAIVDLYIDCLMKAKLRPIAIEFQPLSFVRAFPFVPEHTILVTLTGKNHSVVFITRNNVILFQRILPNTFAPGQNIETEIKKITDYYEAEAGHVDEIMDTESLMMSPTLVELDKRLKGNDIKWATVLGAALRGVMPRGEDTLISLMPIGTEEAYRYQKAATFTELLSNSTIGLSIFFTIMMCSVWMFALLLEEHNLNKISAQAPVVKSEVIEMGDRAKSLSRLLGAEASIIQTLPRWSIAVQKLEPLTGEEILINALSVNTPETPITLSGVAKTRIELNAFKRRIEESGMASNIILPIGNLGLKQDIPFMLSFILRHPEDLYQY